MDPTRHSPILRLVLVTPARNEGTFLESTIRAVITQTVVPMRWIIVNDGSKDDTAAIVERYRTDYPWIELVNVPRHSGRNFAGKVHAFNLGYARLSGLNYDVIGNLDADITFDNKYLEFLLEKFTQDPLLGVAGTPFTEGEEQYDYRFTSTNHVSGACQLFKRECFEEIGGYVPIAIGGIDLVAVLTARSKGWKTKAFCDKTCVHHRKMGTAKQRRLMVAFKGGKGDYMLGTHPLWEVVRTPYQMTRQPVVLAGGLRLAGFLWAMIGGATIVVPKELAEFRRKEQMLRLRSFLRGLFKAEWSSATEAAFTQRPKL
jgi:biofilm PGA synthesis N-glycosyltransferase PgaC